MNGRIGTYKRRCRLAAGFGLLLAVALPSPSASAAVSFVDIGAPSGPLTHVVAGNDLSCQIQHTGDTSFELFPSGANPGDCGTFLAVGGTLYTPDFSNHSGTATSSLGTRTPFTAVSQTPKTGSGTSASPFRVVTIANAGAGLTLTETDSYVVGQESYRSDVAVHNGGGAAQSVILYRAGDCYLQNSDTGFGFTGANGAVGCSATANNTPAGRIEEWVPITGGNNFLEARYSDVWAAIGAQTPFSNMCSRCTENTDNGAGISWTATIQPGQTQTFSHYTTFSPTGQAGPPPPTGPPPSIDIQQARRPTCLSIPSVVRDRFGRVPGVGTVTLKTRQVDNPALPVRLSIKVSAPGAIASVTFQVNGRTVVGTTLRTRSLQVPLSYLKIGSRFRNKIKATVVFTNGKVIQLTQFMVILRCHAPAAQCKRLAGGKRLRCVSRTPLSGRRVRVTVTRSATETATGAASVRNGRFTVTVRSASALGLGIYAFKVVVTTDKRGVRFQMIRLVTVR